MAPKKTRLTKLRINEVSLVDRPANPAARVVLAKRDESADDDIEKAKKLTCVTCGGAIDNGKCVDCGVSMAKVDAADPDETGDTDDLEKAATMFASSMASDKLYSYTGALRDSIASILSDNDVTDKPALIVATIGQFRDAIMTGVAATAASDATVADASEDEDDGDDDSTTEETTKMSTTNTDAGLLKGLAPEAVEQVNAAITKATAPLLERVEKAEKEADALKTEIAKRDRITKAKVLIGDAPIDLDMAVDVLEKSGETGEKLITDMAKRLTAAYQAGHLFEEVGKSGGERVDTTPVGKLEAAVTDIRKSDSKLSYEAAVDKALAANPALYDALIAK